MGLMYNKIHSNEVKNQWCNTVVPTTLLYVPSTVNKVQLMHYSKKNNSIIIPPTLGATKFIEVNP